MGRLQQYSRGDVLCHAGSALSFDDFKEEFGDTIDFGAYCGAADNLPDVITHVISATDYAQLARNAHEAVKDYTWSQYVDAFLSKLRKLDLIHD